MRIRVKYASSRAVTMARARRQGRARMLSSSRGTRNASVNQNSSLSCTEKKQSTKQSKQITTYEEIQNMANDLKKQVNSMFDFCRKIGEESEKKTTENTVDTEKEKKTEEFNKEEILSYAKKIVSDYNHIMEDISEVGDSSSIILGNQLKSLVKEHEKELKQVGISLDRKGYLSLDDKEAAKVTLSTMQSVFGKKSGVFDRLKEKCDSIEKNAATTIQVMNRLYGTSGVYSKYGKNSAYYGSNGSYYSALG